MYKIFNIIYIYLNTYKYLFIYILKILKFKVQWILKNQTVLILEHMNDTNPV